MKRTRHVFRDFLFDGPMLGLGSNIANESLCSNACLGFPMCLNEIVRDERVWYGVSPTRSYGAIENLPPNQFACVKICQAGMKLPNMFLEKYHKAIIAKIIRKEITFRVTDEPSRAVNI